MLSQEPLVSPAITSPFMVRGAPFAPAHDGILGTGPTRRQFVLPDIERQKVLVAQAGLATELRSLLNTDWPIGALLGLKLHQRDEERTEPRAREGAWKRAHESFLRDHKGYWFVVERDELIAFSRIADEAVREAREKGISTPYLFFVSDEPEGVARIGL